MFLQLGLVGTALPVRQNVPGFSGSQCSVFACVRINSLTVLEVAGRVYLCRNLEALGSTCQVGGRADLKFGASR